MTRFRTLVGACLLVASVVGFGALGGGPFGGGPTAAAESPDETSDAQRLLVVEVVETGERLLAVPVSEGTRVALNYTHSVEKTPVLDVYEVNGTDLEMVRMEFHSFGAGLPSRAEVNRTDDGAFAFDPEGSYEQLYVKPGRIAGHDLTVGNRTFDLVALSDARSVNVYVTNRSSLETTALTLL